eukprot:403331727
MQHLSDIHNVLVANHEKDFLSSYKEHMNGVQIEIALLKKKSSEEYTKMKKDDRIQYLEQTIQWLREEIIGLTVKLEQFRKNQNILQKQLNTEQEKQMFLQQIALSAKKQNQLLKSTVDQLKDPNIQYIYKRRIQKLRQEQYKLLEKREPIKTATQIVNRDTTNKTQVQETFLQLWDFEDTAEMSSLGLKLTSKDLTLSTNITNLQLKEQPQLQLEI